MNQIIKINDDSSIELVYQYWKYRFNSEIDVEMIEVEDVGDFGFTDINNNLYKKGRSFIVKGNVHYGLSIKGPNRYLYKLTGCYSCCDITYHFKEGLLHNSNGPAIHYPNGTCSFYIEGLPCIR